MADLPARVLPPKGAGFVIFGLGSPELRAYGFRYEDLDLHLYLLHLPLSYSAVGLLAFFLV
jgi:hypothetical protein